MVTLETLVLPVQWTGNGSHTVYSGILELVPMCGAYRDRWLVELASVHGLDRFDWSLRTRLEYDQSTSAADRTIEILSGTSASDIHLTGEGGGGTGIILPCVSKQEVELALTNVVDGVFGSMTLRKVRLD